MHMYVCCRRPRPWLLWHGELLSELAANSAKQESCPKQQHESLSKQERNKRTHTTQNKQLAANSAGPGVAELGDSQRRRSGGGPVAARARRAYERGRLKRMGGGSICV